MYFLLFQKFYLAYQNLSKKTTSKYKQSKRFSALDVVLTGVSCVQMFVLTIAPRDYHQVDNK